MTEVKLFKSNSSKVPTFDALEFELPTIGIEELSRGIGRLSIFNILLKHQIAHGLNPETQVWSGINGISLFRERSLFSDLNPLADHRTLNANFNATQLGHWRSVIGEAKYSPFTYIYKGYASGRNTHPVITGFDVSKLLPSRFDDENIDWQPKAPNTTEGALKSVYYFTGLFPDSESSELRQ